MSQEPNNPDHCYTITSTETIDGVRGKAKIKKWFADGKFHEKVIAFEPYEEVKKDDA